MKIGLLLSAAFPLLLLAACGGGDPEDSGPAGNATPAKVPVEAETAAVKKQPASDAQDPASKEIKRPRIDNNMVKILFGNETAAPAAEVESSASLVELGNALYHSEKLSAGGNVSCASCHDLSNYGVDGKSRSTGADGKAESRNTPTTYNAFRQFTQDWDGRSPSVEAQAIEHACSVDGLGMVDEANLVAKLQQQPDLVAGFAKAFPGDAGPVTAKNFGKAIGAFERTLVTKSKWDDYLDGNQRALSNEALLGMKTFMEVGCTTCHINRTLGGHMFQKSGLLKPYPTEDAGRMQVTKNAVDNQMFKVPVLLNVEKTAPYYHDGKIATLREAVVKMADMQLAKQLTDEQTDAILAFLKATTGKLPEQFAKK